MLKKISDTYPFASGITCAYIVLALFLGKSIGIGYVCAILAITLTNSWCTEFFLKIKSLSKKTRVVILLTSALFNVITVLFVGFIANVGF